MSLPRSVADVIDQHVTLELESLDRVYLNVYQPQLQTPRAVFWFLHRFHGEGAVSSHKMRAITERFLSAIVAYRYEVAMTQVEFTLTQVMGRPVSGRIFFEEAIRENLDLGRPHNIQLIFDRRVIKTTPGRFRSRAICHGVIPSLRIDYKTNGIKQYFKEGRAVRTELTVQNPYESRATMGLTLANPPTTTTTI